VSSMSKKTLLVSPSNKCEGNCHHCSLVALNEKERFLPLRAIERLGRLWKNFMFDESIILCTNPLKHTQLPSIIELLQSFSRKIHLFININSLSNALDKSIFERINEIVLVIPSIELARRFEKHIKVLISQGIENISLYYVVMGTAKDIGNIFSLIPFCRTYGLSLRVGEPPYSKYVNINPITLLEGKRNVEICLRYGTLYGYYATNAFIKGYPVTLLAKPFETTCRMLYVDASGRVGKCPILDGRVHYRKVDEKIVRRFIFSKCTSSHFKLEFIPVANISLMIGDKKEIPHDVLMLLEVIEQLKSFRAACSALGFSTSTYMEKIKSLEYTLGFKLLTSEKGGKIRGRTVLTDKGRYILQLYKEISESVNKYLYQNMHA